MRNVSTAAKLRVMATLSRRRGTVVAAEVVAGEPQLGMEFTSPEVEGRWRVASFGFDSGKIASRTSMMVQPVGAAKPLREGVELVQA